MAFDLEQYRADQSSPNKEGNQPFDLEQYRASPNDIMKRKFPFQMNLGNKSLEQIVPGAEQLRPGIKEGLQGALGAIPGLSKYLPVPAPESPIPDEQDAGLMRNVGRGIGAAPVIGAIAAPLAFGGEALGIPAAIAETGAAGVGGGLTTRGDLFHRGVGAAEAAAPVGIGKAVATLPGIARTLLSKLEPSKLPAIVQKGHDMLLKRASDIFDFVKDEVVPSGVSKIDVPESVIDQAAEHLPKTDATRKLIENAKSGDYNALHQLQSDLGQSSREAMASSTYAERNQGKEMHEVRNKINDSIINRFREYGQDRLANLLTEAKNMYRNLKETYYDHPGVAKLVEKGMRKEPKNPMAFFSEKSDPMRKVLNAHPEIGEALKLYGEKQKIAKALKTAGMITGIGAPSGAIGALAAWKYLLGGNKPPESADNENIGEQ